MPSTDATVTATYKAVPANTYTVTFNAQGGSVTPTSKTIVSGNKYGNLPVPTNISTYTFCSWYTEENGNGTHIQEDMLFSLSSSQTLYANWYYNVGYAQYWIPEVYFDCQGGTCEVSRKSMQSLVFGALPTPTRSGYIFDGWYTEPSGGGERVEEDTPNNVSYNLKNRTIYAKWAANTYTVTYNANGGSVSPPSTTVNPGSSVTTPTPTKSYTLTYNVNGGNAVSPSSKSVPCTCNGWFTATSGGTNRAIAGASYTPTQTETIYAQWANPNMETLPTPTHPTSGYTFKGWFTATSGGTQVTSSTTMTGNQTIYAQWQIINMTIDTDGDGLPDAWEIYGADVNGDGIIDIPLNLMGADPNIPDIYVEIDWMAPGGGKTFQPTEASMKAVYDAFKAKDIRLHIDIGPESTDYVTGTKWKNYPGGSGANAFAYSAANQYPYPPGDSTNWNKIINNNFTASRRRIFHHSAFVANLGDYGGWGNVRGQHTLLLKQEDQADSFCFMHELGHNLGLRHGGQDTINYKPNYISIMNYSLSYNPKLGLNYSEQALPDLNEAGLLESNGVDPGGLFMGRGYESFFIRNGSSVLIPSISKTAIDWNGNGRTTDTGVRMDINGDGGIDILKGFKDWDKLVFKGGNIGVVSAGAIADDIYPNSYFDQFEMPVEVTIEELIDLGFYFPEDSPTYILTLNANGGSVSPESIIVTNGGIYSALPTPTRANYTFDGWYTAASGGSKINPTDTVNLSGNTTLYAHWSAISQPKGIFGTNPKWYGEWWHYLLFFLCFGFIWMWF